LLFEFLKDCSLINKIDFVNKLINNINLNMLISKQKQINIQIITKKALTMNMNKKNLVINILIIIFISKL